MSLEGFSKRGMELGNDPEGLSETKNDLRQQYLSAIKRLALEKMKNDILFEGKLGATIKNLSLMGLNITRESILRDIETEITRQGSDLRWGEYAIQKAGETNNRLEDMNESLGIPTSFDELPKKEVVIDEVKAQIESLKNNLSSLFELTSTQPQKPLNTSGTIPREPAIETVAGAENIRLANLRELREMQEGKDPVLVHFEEEKQGIRNPQVELAKTLEWVKQQPNEPTFTSTRSDNFSLSPERTKDYGISGNIEPIREQVRNGLESANKGQNFDDIYELELKKLIELKKSNSPNYETELNNAIAEISSLTDRIPNIREQIESDISYEMRNINSIQQQEEASTSTLEQVEYEGILQEQQAVKSKIIDRIMNGMNMAGEFSFGDISMDERMSIMQNVQNKLRAKSVNELQMLLATYQEQNVQEETMQNGMYR